MSACTNDCSQGRTCACYDSQAANRAAQWSEFYRRNPLIEMEDVPEEMSLAEELRYQAIRTVLLVVSVMIAGGVMGAVWHWVVR